MTLILVFALVSGTDTKPTKEIKYKKQFSGGTRCKITAFIFSCSAFVGMSKEAKSGKKKESSVGETLAKYRLFPSVSGTDTTSTKEIKYKEEISGGTPCKIPVVIFS